MIDKTIVVSEGERILLHSLEPKLNISVIPNGIDTTTYEPHSLEEKQKNILIVGTMDYEPNVDAVKFFYSEIFPLI